MVRVRTQREVLEHYGKNPNDRSFVSRKIVKGEVIKEGWGYSIMDNDPAALGAEISRLVYDNDKLSSEVEYLKGELEKCSKNTTQECSNNTTVEVNNWENEGNSAAIKKLEEENKSMMDAYVRALKRMRIKNEFIESLILSMKKVEYPRGWKDDGDYFLEVCERFNYDANDDNYL